MKVLLVGDYPPPQGGISVHVAGLAAILLLGGHEVRVLDVGRPAKPVRPAAYVTVATGAFQVAREILLATHRGFLVHVHLAGHNLGSWLRAAVATAFSVPWGPPSVVTVHSGLAPDYLGHGKGRRWLARIACRRAALVICASEAIARSLRLSGVRPGRVEVLPAFLAVLPGAAPAPLAAFRGGCARLVSAALGVGPEYGAELLLAAFVRATARLPGLGLVVLGAGAGPAFRARVEALGLSRVLALGEVSHPEALAVVAASDLFVRPTLADGDANSVREALSLGVPVLASAVAQRPEGTHCAPPEPGPFGDALAALASEGRRLVPSRGVGAELRLLEIYRSLGPRPIRRIAARPV